MIATDWLYNSDVVLDGKTGLLVPIKNPEALCDAILRLYNDRPFQLTLAKNSLKEAIKYLPDTVLTKLYEFIEK
jgi:glycosyltransferase involved in cell wall biosynthesis